MTYTFLDPIVFLAYRVPHLSHDMLPPLADYDYTKNLVRRSFKAGTPFTLHNLSLPAPLALGYLFWKSEKVHLLGFLDYLSCVPRLEFDCRLS